MRGWTPVMPSQEMNVVRRAWKSHRVVVPTSELGEAAATALQNNLRGAVLNQQIASRLRGLGATVSDVERYVAAGSRTARPDVPFMMGDRRAFVEAEFPIHARAPDFTKSQNAVYPPMIRGKARVVADIPELGLRSGDPIPAGSLDVYVGRAGRHSGNVIVTPFRGATRMGPKGRVVPTTGAPTGDTFYLHYDGRNWTAYSPTRLERPWIRIPPPNLVGLGVSAWPPRFSTSKPQSESSPTSSRP